jgi:hypothetical protein
MDRDGRFVAQALRDCLEAIVLGRRSFAEAVIVPAPYGIGCQM